MLSALVVALALATPAAANHPGYEPSDPLTRSAFALAQQHWGGAAPACLSHAVLYHEQPGSFAIARGELGGCRMWITYELYAKRYENPAFYCSVIAHEYGHNLGYPHSSESTSIMRPALYPVDATPECRARYRRCPKKRRPRCRSVRAIAARL